MQCSTVSIISAQLSAFSDHIQTPIFTFYSFRKLEFGIWNFTLGIWNLVFGIWNLKFEIWNLEFGIWILDFEIWNFEFEIWNFKKKSPLKQEGI